MKAKLWFVFCVKLHYTCRDYRPSFSLSLKLYQTTSLQPNGLSPPTLGSLSLAKVSRRNILPMQTGLAFSKELGGMVLSWGGPGSQTACFEDPFGHPLKSSSRESSAFGKQLAAPDQDEDEKEHGILEKGNPTKFTISLGECKNSSVQKFQLQNSSSIPLAVLENPTNLELGFSQPLICTRFPHGEQHYGVFSTYGPPLTGRIMLPLNSATDEGPIFVNAKQYKGIIRRRMYRAKAELKNNALRKQKPYLHLSRHLHAMRRPRGCGGRFLNTKELSGSKSGTDDKNTGGGLLSWPTGSQTSEVLQSDGRNSNSPVHRSNTSATEVTSVYSREDHDPFFINRLQSSVMNAGHGFALASKWAPAADVCCNLDV